MSKKRITGVSGGCLIVCLVLAAGAVFGGRYLFRSAAGEPATIDIQITAPSQVPVDEPFQILIRIIDIEPGGEAQLLHSIDISDSYLEGFELVETEPAFTNSFGIPFVNFQSYVFEQTIPQSGVTAVGFTMVGKEEGVYQGEIDVCIESGSLCKLTLIETTVGDANGR